MRVILCCCLLCSLPLLQYSELFFSETQCQALRTWIYFRIIFTSAKWVRTTRLDLATRRRSSSFFFIMFPNDGWDVPVRMTWFAPDGPHGLPISHHVIPFCGGMWRTVCTYHRYPLKEFWCSLVYHSRCADQLLGGIRLSARCVPCDEWCSHWTLENILWKLGEFIFNVI